MFAAVQWATGRGPNVAHGFLATGIADGATVHNRFVTPSRYLRVTVRMRRSG